MPPTERSTPTLDYQPLLHPRVRPWPGYKPAGAERSGTPRQSRSPRLRPSSHSRRSHPSQCPALQHPAAKDSARHTQPCWRPKHTREIPSPPKVQTAPGHAPLSREPRSPCFHSPRSHLPELRWSPLTRSPKSTPPLTLRKGGTHIVPTSSSSQTPRNTAHTALSLAFLSHTKITTCLASPTTSAPFRARGLSQLKV